jgi:hypothetical protein
MRKKVCRLLVSLTYTVRITMHGSENVNLQAMPQQDVMLTTESLQDSTSKTVASCLEIWPRKFN